MAVNLPPIDRRTFRGGATTMVDEELRHGAAKGIFTSFYLEVFYNLHLLSNPLIFLNHYKSP
jgi:hypothetical protein